MTRIDVRDLKGKIKDNAVPDTKVKETTPKDGFLHTVLTIPKPKEYTK